MRRLVVASIALLIAAAPLARAEEPPIAAGFEAPESAVWDPGSQAWYVSSKGGTGFDNTQDDGFISKVSSSGDVLALRWVEGLTSPFGIDVHDGRLYAADLSVVRVIDVASATLIDTIEIPGADGALNDLTVDDATGDVYTSASGQNRIYRVPAGGAGELFLESAELDSPNGLLVEGDTLVVATLGLSNAPSGGRVLRMDIATQVITPLSAGIGVLDGLVRDEDRYLVTDFINGRLIAVDATTGEGSTVLPGLPSAADLGIDHERGIVGIPVTFPNLAVFLPV